MTYQETAKQMMTMRVDPLKLNANIELFELKLAEIKAQLALKKAQKKKKQQEQCSATSTLQVPQSPQPCTSPNPRNAMTDK